MSRNSRNKKERGAGVLLPISSVPSKYGIGSLGKESYRFIDWLVEAGQKFWQVLPVGPTSFGDSPYQSFSAFAGNPYFIDLDLLVKEELISKDDIEAYEWGEKENEVDYEVIFHSRFELLRTAFQNSQHKVSKEFKAFCRKNAFWLEDYSLFMSLKNHFKNMDWLNWDEDIRMRQKDALQRYRIELSGDMDFWKFCQYQFLSQWNNLKKYANENNIKLIGDIPLYVSMDSSDVWVHGSLFELDERMMPIHVAGVPPDAFSADGQRWGNPLYRWDEMEKTDFRWWRERMKVSAELYDVIRIDHFIGIVRYFSIPAEAETAQQGSWRAGPGIKLTNVIKESVGDTQIIAEDLGVIVPKVRALIKRTGWPSMKVLEFAFDSNAENEYLPHKYETSNCVVYGGTHDNETLVGFFGDQKKKELQYLFDYLEIEKKKEIPKAMIRLAYSSIANLAIIQMQDILELDNEARMNLPATVGTNWRWRMTKNQLTKKDASRLRKLAQTFAR